MKTGVLIPAYEPSMQLYDLVQSLASRSFDPILVVNDGCSPECDAVFDRIRPLLGVTLLKHAVNLGKGAALKTGLNYFLLNHPELPGIVTADADGQHKPEDIQAVAKALEHKPDCLIMGVRTFTGKVPFRSLFGNRLTGGIFWLLIGRRIQDTQSGLRGIPRRFMPVLLRIPSHGYEFELEMLIRTKAEAIPVHTQEIETIYLNNNQSSHFNPLIDSMKIYFVFIRFMSSSFVTALVDYFVFFLTFSATSSILSSTIAARGVATGVNYVLVQRLVFRSSQPGWVSFSKFVALVCVMGAASFGLISVMSTHMGMNIFIAKIIAEGILYLANFAIQREFVFSA